MFKTIVKIKPEKDIDYFNFIETYPKFFNAFLYQNSKTLFKLHNDKSYMFITFTKPFFVKNNKLLSSEVYNIIIKTANKDVFNELYNNLKNKTKPIFLRGGEFKIEKVNRKYTEKIKNFDTIIMRSPIIITKKVNNKINSITYEENKEEFLSALQKNMIKKYNFFYETDIPEDFNLFNNIEINSRGSFSTQTGFKNNFLVGSELVFKLGVLSNIKKRIIQFNYDVGFGEKTALGFGFPDVKQKYTLEEFQKDKIN